MPGAWLTKSSSEAVARWASSGSAPRASLFPRGADRTVIRLSPRQVGQRRRLLLSSPAPSCASYPTLRELSAHIRRRSSNAGVGSNARLHGQVAEYVEVAEAVELAVQLAAALGGVACVGLRHGAERREHVCAQLRVGLEVAHPVDGLGLLGHVIAPTSVNRFWLGMLLLVLGGRLSARS
jgi:hypothetical protein